MRRDRSLTPDQITLILLDGFELYADGRALSLTRTTQRLLAFLALADRPLPRSFVAGNLWLETTEERASASLRSALWRLRQIGCSLVVATSSHLILTPSLAVDIRGAQALARRLINPLDECEDLIADSRVLSRDLLPDWHDDWVVMERERFRQLRLHGLEALCRRMNLAGRLAEAVEAGLAAVRAEPLRESAQRALIGSYLAEGNLGEAIRQYESFEKLLHDELRTRPSPELRALFPQDSSPDHSRRRPHDRGHRRAGAPPEPHPSRDTPVMAR